MPSRLLALVTMILEGPSIKDQSEDRTPAALSIAQLLKFNSTKGKRDNASSVHVKHSTAQETPVPRYIGLMLHAHSRKRELIDRLNHLGLSISYDRVLRLSAQMGNSVCELFQLSVFAMHKGLARTNSRLSPRNVSLKDPNQ